MVGKDVLDDSMRNSCGTIFASELLCAAHDCPRPGDYLDLPQRAPVPAIADFHSALRPGYASQESHDAHRETLMLQQLRQQCKETLGQVDGGTDSGEYSNGSVGGEQRVPTLYYWCPDCGVTFNRRDNLRRHVAKIHPRDCPTCGERFADSHALYQHEVHHRLGQKVTLPPHVEKPFVDGRNSKQLPAGSTKSPAEIRSNGDIPIRGNENLKNHHAHTGTPAAAQSPSDVFARSVAPSRPKAPQFKPKPTPAAPPPAVMNGFLDPPSPEVQRVLLNIAQRHPEARPIPPQMLQSIIDNGMRMQHRTSPVRNNFPAHSLQVKQWVPPQKMEAPPSMSKVKNTPARTPIRGRPPSRLRDITDPEYEGVVIDDMVRCL